MSNRIYDAEMQYLTIAFASKVGLNRAGRVVQFDRNFETLRDAGLSPLLLYTVTAPAYALSRRELVDPQEPRAIAEFLAWAWSASEGLGMPNRLEMNPKLAESDAGFAAWLRAKQVEVVSASSASLRAFERSAQDIWFPVCWNTEDWEQRERPLQDANRSIAQYTRFSEKVMHRKSMDQMTFEAWSARPRRFVQEPTGAKLDWRPSMLVQRERTLPRLELRLASPDERPHIQVRALREVLQMWPGGASHVLRDAGMTRREFDRWTSGRAEVDHHQFDRLTEILGLYHDPGVGDYEMGGGYLLVAATKQGVEEAYNALGRGGDVSYSVELVGPAGEEGEMRFLLFESMSGRPNIVLFERRSPAEKALTKSSLPGFEGEERTPQGVWQMAQEIMKLANFPVQGHKVADLFVKAHADWRDQLIIDRLQPRYRT